MAEVAIRNAAPTAAEAPLRTAAGLPVSAAAPGSSKVEGV
jgi:hypothetical protein